jgi:hypothetical protein
VHTPYVLVLPHDMEFSHTVDLAALCAILADTSAGVNYIGFGAKNRSLTPCPNDSSTRVSITAARSNPVLAANPNLLNYPERVRAKSGIALTPLAFSGVPTPPCEPTLLLPLFRWKENPHIASVRQYEQVVFGPAAWPKIKRGQFIEETVGQRQNDLILREGGADGWREAHAAWGTYLYWPSVPTHASSEHAEKRGIGVTSAKAAPPTFAVTHHLDGHTYRTVDERLASGHMPHAFEIERSAEAARLFAGDGDAAVYTDTDQSS